MESVEIAWTLNPNELKKNLLQKRLSVDFRLFDVCERYLNAGLGKLKKIVTSYKIQSQGQKSNLLQLQVTDRKYNLQFSVTSYKLQVHFFLFSLD